MRFLHALGFVSLLTVAAPSAAAEEFTLDDLKALVAEFEKVVPQNPLYSYPIEITLLESEEVNAAAGVRLNGEQLQATLEANTGFIAAVEGDPAMMRAVIAHEMAHLSLGHALESSDYGDLEQFLTRQQEFAADEAGAAYLEALGYERSEMVGLLEFLDSTLPRGAPIWLGTVGSDHGSPVTRAALINRDSTVFAALSRLEVGAAFMECRRYEEAILWFETALLIEPRMHEAHIDIALAALQNYYERLPVKVQSEWLRPAFLPHLTSTSLIAGRAVEVTDQDLERYKRVLERIDQIPNGPYDLTRAFIRGTLEVLHPSGDAATIEAGIERLKLSQALFISLMPSAVQENEVRIANNVALGLQRLGREKEAQLYLVSRSMQAATAFVRAAAENVGRLPFADLDADQSREALNVTVTYLMNTPPGAPNYDQVKSTMQRLLDSLNLELSSEIEPRDIYLCQAVSMTLDDEELLLFDPVDDYAKKLGEPDDAGFLLEKYPDLGCVIWGGGDVMLLTERGSVLKITSYRANSSITLKPSNSSSREVFFVWVGMSLEDLNRQLALAGGQSASVSTQLFGRTLMGDGTQIENWDYYPALNFGVLLEDGMVVGISVTPVKA